MMATTGFKFYCPIRNCSTERKSFKLELIYEMENVEPDNHSEFIEICNFVVSNCSDNHSVEKPRASPLFFIFC